MCVGCFFRQMGIEDGYNAAILEGGPPPVVTVSADEITDDVRDLVKMIKAHYEVRGNSAGGRYHVHLDDWNVDIEMDPDWAHDPPYWGPPTEADREMAIVWNRLTERQRTLALALWDDLDKPSPYRRGLLGVGPYLVVESDG